MASSILPFLDVVSQAAVKHGFASAVGYRHDANTDTLRVTLTYADGTEGQLVFSGQLVADLAAPERTEAALVAIEQGVIALAKATP